MTDDCRDVETLRAQAQEMLKRTHLVIRDSELREHTEQRLRDLLARAARIERGDPPAESATTRRRLPPEPPGRQWLKHAPGMLDCFVVRRRFTTDDGEGVRPDEIICPGLAWWESRPVRRVLFSDGYLEPLTMDTLAWQCPHMRFFATPEAFAAHGCADLPPADDEATDPSSTELVELPPGLKGRDAAYARHWRDRKSASEIAALEGVTTRTVEKAIVRLRRTFGPGIIPLRRSR